jgi:hypothetical protein
MNLLKRINYYDHIWAVSTVWDSSSTLRVTPPYIHFLYMNCVASAEVYKWAK